MWMCTGLGGEQQRNMSTGYQSLKPPEAVVDYDDSDDNSIQGSPMLNTGPVFPRNSVIDTPDDIDLGDQMSYYQDEAYEDELYGSPYQPRGDSPHHTIEEADPYVGTSFAGNGRSYSKGSGGSLSKRGGYVDLANESPSRTSLEPIIEPVSETASAAVQDRRVSDKLPNSEEPGSKTGLSSPLRVADSEPASPHSHLQFTRSRKRPKSAFISPSFRAPSGTNIIGEPAKSSVSRQQFTESKIYEPKAPSLGPSTGSSTGPSMGPSAGLSARPSAGPSAGESAIGGDDDEDTLPFEATTRMAMQGRPQSMIQLTSPDRGMVMTKESFENYRRSIMESDLLNRESSIASGRFSPSKYNSISRGSSPTRGGGSAIGYDEDEKDLDYDDSPEKEQKRKSARLRQEQDARMSIYRQSMMKIIGNSPGALGDGESMNSARTIPDNKSISVDRADVADADLMDDIPLSILQAHRFPKKSSHSKSPVPTSPSMMITDYHDIADNAESTRTTPRARGRAETGSAGTSPRPLSVASSRMLPNVFNSDSSRHSRGFGGYNSGHAMSSPALPQVFGNKDGMLSRGLIGEISREEEVRKKRQTIGYGIENNYNNTSPSPAVPAVGSLKDPGALQDKLDIVIEMLSKMSPQDAGISHQPANSYGNEGTLRPVVQRASSISSFQTGDQYGGMGTPTSSTAMPYSPHFGYAPFGHQQHMSFPPPQLPPNHLPPVPNSPFYPTVPRPAAVSNRPSRMRLVNPMDGEDEDDGDDLKKLKEERESLKQKWMQQSEESNHGKTPSSTVDSTTLEASLTEAQHNEIGDTETQNRDPNELA